MATSYSSTTFVEMEPPPDIATPDWSSAPQSQPHFPLRHHTPHALRHFSPVQTDYTGT